MTWNGRKVGRNRAILADRTQWPTPCAKGCGRMLRREAPKSWVLGHIKPRWERPDLEDVPTNWQVECRPCSDASGEAEKRSKWMSEGAKQVGTSSFPGGDPARQSPPLPVSPPEAPAAPIAVRDGLFWSPERLAAFEWLRGSLDVPEDASPPLWMTPPPADAVGSYGVADDSRAVCPEGAVAWIERTLRITLRWWQRLAIIRQLEHRVDGSLCHREVIESAPRRAGKSLRIKGLVLWRMEHGYQLFDEVQTCVHTGSDVAVCRKLQKESWAWALAQRWTVTKANGKEAIENAWAQWLVRSQDGVYGWDVMYGLVDEGWDVKPDTVTEGLEPATLERSSPQLHLTSTAHRRATSLMRVKIADALTIDDPEVLLIVWAAPFGADPGDPEVWRAASPHWSADRAKLIAKKYEKALAGEADPEADDPDPMAGFTAQYLNLWRLRERKADKGDALVGEAAWQALVVDAPYAVPDAAAVEGWPGEGVSVALAWRLGDRAVVTVSDHPDLTAAVAAVRESGFRGATVVGASLLDDPAVKPLRKRKGEGRVIAAVQEFRRLVAEDVVRHDGGEHLTAQVQGTRTLPSTDGLRIVDPGRRDAIKAAVWAVERTRFARSANAGIILPTKAPAGV